MAEGFEVKTFCGACPDSHCGEILYFIPQINSEVECSKCGQTHKTNSLLDVKESTNSNIAVGNLLKSILLCNTAPKKGSELVKVRGLSNFHCKLISPLLTSYGMDKKTGKAKLLKELGQAEIFDCAVFSNRAFLIEKEHLDTQGYGKDTTGSSGYLKDTLGNIEKANGGECLIPLHSDGDGHCLVHAISRAVIGRELLWHSLRQNLKDHLQQENIKYQALFRDFIDANEWDEIINEADPNYHPATNEPFGLRNMHVFGLANVLHRPIILLDSLEGMQSCGDYSGIFLPVLVPMEECKSKGSLNKPLAIAWSSLARNHYVPLVGVRDSDLPRIPRALLPKAWGISNELVSKYIEFDQNDCCEIGGSRSLPENYVQRLVSAMDEVFFEKHQVSPELVADVSQFVFKPSNALGFSIPEIIEFTQNGLENECLFQCLSCQALKEVKDRLPRSWREPGGLLYTRAQKETDAGLVADAVYMFTEAKGVPFMYQVRFDMLMPAMKKDQDEDCDLCKGAIREVAADGSIRYMNGDRTPTKSNNERHGCQCGCKHFWNGKEYDNIPKTIDVSLEWNGKTIEEQVFWFDNESDPSLNSNVFEMATAVVQKHFPGEFGSETLVRRVVDKILRETELKKNEEAPALPPESVSQPMDTDSQQAAPATPSKIILTGPKQTTLHKEELTMSDEERLTKARISHRAAYSQKRKSTKQSPEKSSGSTKHGKQEIHKSGKDKAQPQSTATITQAPASRPKTTEIKIRLTSSTGKTATISLKPDSTYNDLQETIQAELGISKDRQKIRYGFPPRELKPPEDERDTLPLTHGDRVSVDELPDPNAQEEERLAKETESESMDVEAKGSADGEEKGVSSDGEFDDVSSEKLASDLLSLLQGAMNIDQWETLQHKPEMFARGGLIYEQIEAKVGTLRDDMHCHITGLPGKTFAYNAEEDRFEICLGQRHIPVQPLDPETLSKAHGRTGDVAPLRRPRDEAEGLGHFSGAVRHRDASEGRATFSGTGRTLGGSVKTDYEQKKEEILSPMNVDVPDDKSAHVQSALSSSIVSKAFVDKPVNEEGEATIMDTQDDVNLTTQSDPNDEKTPAAEIDQNETRKVNDSVHETSTTEHEMSELKRVGGDVDNEMVVDGNEVANSLCDDGGDKVINSLSDDAGDKVMNSQNEDGGGKVINSQNEDGGDKLINSQNEDGGDKVINSQNEDGKSDKVMNSQNEDGGDKVMNAQKDSDSDKVINSQNDDGEDKVTNSQKDGDENEVTDSLNEACGDEAVNPQNDLSLTEMSKVKDVVTNANQKPEHVLSSAENEVLKQDTRTTEIAANDIPCESAPSGL